MFRCVCTKLSYFEKTVGYENLTMTIESAVQLPVAVLSSSFVSSWLKTHCHISRHQREVIRVNCNRVENKNVIRCADYVIAKLAYIYPMSMRDKYAWGSLTRQGKSNKKPCKTNSGDSFTKQRVDLFFGKNFAKECVDLVFWREIC
jgi:hypothetical protein